MLVYIFYNSRVTNCLHGPVVQAKRDTMAKGLAALPLTYEQRNTISWALPDRANSSSILGGVESEEEGSDGMPGRSEISDDDES